MKNLYLSVCLLVLVSIIGLSAMPSIAGQPPAMLRTKATAAQTDASDDAAEAVQAAPQGNAGGDVVRTASAEYVLGTGDQVRLTVYGEDDLSGTYEIGSTGIVALPLIGNVTAANTTIRQFEEAVRKKLSSGYLQNPHVNVQVVNYRPFFILGEVAKPGSYPYVNGMTVLNAVALAGGYTYRADSSGAKIVRASEPKKGEQSIEESDPVLPGDVVRIPERFF